MNKILFYILLLFGIAQGAFSQHTESKNTGTNMDVIRVVSPITPVNKERIKEIGHMLDKEPEGFGDTYHVRTRWEQLKATGKYNKVMKEAEQMLTSSFPVWNEEVYMSFFTKGDSQSGKDILTSRLRWLIILTWAECLENRGRFVSRIEMTLDELINQKTWVNPRNFNEKTCREYIELSTSSYVHNLSQALYLLDDKLNPELRGRVLKALYDRVFTPLLRSTRNLTTDHGWLESTNNWNAVCLSGATCAALTVIPEKELRAEFIAIAEQYIKNFVSGYLNDGYCTEGLGYYNYGFSHYMLLREKILQETNGRIDLFTDNPKILKMAEFLPNMEIVNGIYPSIADCRSSSGPSPSILRYMSRSLGMGLSADTLSLEGRTNELMLCIMDVFPNSMPTAGKEPTGKTRFGGIRSYFPDAGVLTVRPLAGSGCKMAATMKGGTNNEHHNHNDLGEYILVSGNELMVEDPGIIPYTDKTFSTERYTYKTIGSYGHPVPLVAGKEQVAGDSAYACVLVADFTRAQDRFVLDITMAYGNKLLKKLTRDFSYSRAGTGVFMVEDNFEFSSPQLFESAIITRKKWKKINDGQLLLEGDLEKVLVTIESSGGRFLLKDEVLSEGGKPYTRLGIGLINPVKSGSLKLVYKPVR